MRHLLWKLLKWGALACLVLAVAMTALVGSLNWRNPQSTAFLDAERERLSEAKPPKAITQVWVPYGRISLSAKRAVIAAEDSAFTQHDGVDWKAIELAMKTNAEKGKIMRGGSTITMQYVKNSLVEAAQLSGNEAAIAEAQEDAELAEQGAEQEEIERIRLENI
jgi:monofunctional biosynthetic peptidoglycan transglycosylase